MSERFAFELEVATLTADEVQLVENYRALNVADKQLALMMTARGELSKFALVSNYQNGDNATFFFNSNNNRHTRLDADANGDI